MLKAGFALWTVGVSAVYARYLIVGSRLSAFLAPLGLVFFIVVLAVFGVVSWFKLRAHLEETVSIETRCVLVSDVSGSLKCTVHAYKLFCWLYIYDTLLSFKGQRISNLEELFH